ncbi:hypothetical protein FisN_6Hh315 [Fistulifera solaris]|jgi:hypothetical protein|uniref:Uncharacterized protein n=1 Tax=Fistulifera solaris TaxID=1519565 RepID=A0A1Z5K7Z2_FISSO|nr:hypothetical protein FisN_6Hh315 [Fistulifera solaris]|eukprot:GAX22068.1 hypothetical protein FisN_6Hh315 [Fistulifera solaris]
MPIATSKLQVKNVIFAFLAMAFLIETSESVLSVIKSTVKNSRRLVGPMLSSTIMSKEAIPFTLHDIFQRIEYIDCDFENDGSLEDVSGRPSKTPIHRTLRGTIDRHHPLDALVMP